MPVESSNPGDTLKSMVPIPACIGREVPGLGTEAAHFILSQPFFILGTAREGADQIALIEGVSRTWQVHGIRCCVSLMKGRWSFPIFRATTCTTPLGTCCAMGRLVCCLLTLSVARVFASAAMRRWNSRSPTSGGKFGRVHGRSSGSILRACAQCHGESCRGCAMYLMRSGGAYERHPRAHDGGDHSQIARSGGPLRRAVLAAQQ